MRKRQGFTLVELLVAMALTMFVMAILSQCFSAALDTFRQLKAIGDMQEGLRTATTTLRADLSLPHFTGNKKASDPDFWSDPQRITFGGVVMDAAAREGFIHIRQGSASVFEGVDGDTIESYRSANHMIFFTGRMRGNQPENYLAAPVPPGSPLLANGNTNYYNQLDGVFQDASMNTFSSQWGVIGYYLVPTGTTVDQMNPGAAGTKLYALYRYQAVVAPRNDVINGGPPPQGVSGDDAYKYVNVAFLPTGPLNAATPVPQFNGALYFPSPMDLTHPFTRPLDTSKVNGTNTFPVWAGTTYSPEGRYNSAGGGVPQLPSSSSLVLMNVVSFNIRVLSDEPRPNPVGGPPVQFVTQTDFTDIDTYPFPTPIGTYPAVWDSSLRGITAVDTSGAQITITSPNHGLTNAYAGQPIYFANLNVLGSPRSISGFGAVVDQDRFTINTPGGPTVPAYIGGGSWSLSPIYNLKALQITLRVWDAKTLQTRQTTLIQDM